MSGARAIFLDRDGTVTEDRGFTHRVEDLRLLPGAAEGLRRMAGLGYRLVLVTNQSGVARGYFTEADADRFNRALVELLASRGVPIAAVYTSPYHPTEGVGPYRRDTDCRKPRPGMLLRAAAEHGLDLAASFMVGDRDTDVQAGRAAGCRTVLLRAGREPDPAADFVAADLAAAAAVIEAHGK